jgi:hypothetical protein
MDQGKAGDAGAKGSFIESATFMGAKRGFFFGTGEQGTGRAPLLPVSAARHAGARRQRCAVC